jgi:hypothetical protein
MGSNIKYTSIDGTLGLGMHNTYGNETIKNYFSSIFNKSAVFSIQFSGLYGQSIIYYENIP